MIFDILHTLQLSESEVIKMYSSQKQNHKLWFCNFKDFNLFNLQLDI